MVHPSPIDPTLRGAFLSAVYQCPRCKNVTHHVWDWDYVKGEWVLNCLCCIYWLTDRFTPLTKEQAKWL